MASKKLNFCEFGIKVWEIISTRITFLDTFLHTFVTRNLLFHISDYLTFANFSSDDTFNS